MPPLFVAWRPPQPDTTGWRPIGRLTHNGEVYRYWYTRGAKEPGFLPFPGMEQLEQVYESEELFPLFANRLLARTRPEYPAFLRWTGFENATVLDPIELLGVTGGRRVTDPIEVFPGPVTDANGLYLNRFFLHGNRWLPQAANERISQLSNGEKLKLILDPQNEHDPKAVGVRTEANRMLIGYVPRYLASDVWTIVMRGDIQTIDLSVMQFNPDAPLQNRVLCEMRAKWPEGFVPCSDENFQPIPQGVG